MCSYESLKTGVVDLADIALMNDVLDVEIENRLRADRANEKQRP